MIWILADTDRERALAEGYSSLALIILIGGLALLLMVLIFIGRRWKRRQIKAIDQDKTARREARSAERVDAWKTGAERYVDRDKLPEGESDLDEHDSDELEDEDGPPPGMAGQGYDDPEEQKDPYGLFDDAPYREPEDEDDEDENDEDWDDDDDAHKGP